MQVAILTGNRPSNGARELRHALTSFGINATRQVRNPRVIVNWGCSELPGPLPNVAILNPPQGVRVAVNKRSSFRAFTQHNVAVPDWTESRDTAIAWIREGHRVYCRTTLTGNSGDGIVVARSIDQLVVAPLYTKGLDTRHEFRLHVMNGVVFDAVRKAFNSDIPEDQRNRDIMNHAAGTTFIRSGDRLQNLPDSAKQLAVDAVQAVGLNFGAVDIIRTRDDRYYVLEVNTACGLEGTTLQRYARAFNEVFTRTPVTPWSFSEFEGNTDMNIQQATPTQQVVYNPSNAPATTLTVGRTYEVVRVGDNSIFIRNDNARLQGYHPSNFRPSPLQQTTPSRRSQTVPVPPPAPVIPETVDTSVEPESPQRIARLADGSGVNPGGTAQFNFAGSQRFRQGSRLEIVEVRVGAESGDVFLGVRLDNGNITRYQSTHFSLGLLANGSSPAATPATPRQEPVNQARDIRNNQVAVGNSVIIEVEAGGHGLRAGLVTQVTAIRPNNQITVSEGSTNINASRVRRLTNTEVETINREREVLARAATTEFTIGSHSYRVLQRDMDELRSLLRRFSV